MNNYTQKLIELKQKPAHLLKEVGDQWRTPDALFWGINAICGPFTLDLFTDGQNAKAASYYTAEDNALLKDWAEDLQKLGGRAFGNPPYSRSSYDDEGNPVTGMRHIIAKAVAERDKGAAFCFLAKVATSETWWPGQRGADAIIFIRGRVGFDLPMWFTPADKKQAASAAGFAACVLIFDSQYQGERERYVDRDALEAVGKHLIAMASAPQDQQLQELSRQLAESRQEVNDLRAQLVATHGTDFTDVLEVPA